MEALKLPYEPLSSHGSLQASMEALKLPCEPLSSHGSLQASMEPSNANHGTYMWASRLSWEPPSFHRSLKASIWASKLSRDGRIQVLMGASNVMVLTTHFKQNEQLFGLYVFGVGDVTGGNTHVLWHLRDKHNSGTCRSILKRQYSDRTNSTP